MIALLSVAALALGAPATGELTVTLTPAEVTVGDRFEASLSLRLPESSANAEPRFPIWQDTWGDAEVLDAPPPERTPDGWRQILTLAIFHPGEVELPAARVQVPGPEGTIEVRSQPVTATVRSVLPEGQEEVDPAPEEPPRGLPWGEPFWWTAGVLAMLCLLAGGALARRAASAAAEVASRASLPALDELRRRLDELRSEELPERLWVGLSLALRRFLGRELSFNAVESTTSEIRRLLRYRDLRAELTARVVELLQEADLVKFARQPTAPEQALRRLEATASLAGEIDAVLRPATPAADGEQEAA